MPHLQESDCYSKSNHFGGYIQFPIGEEMSQQKIECD
jgi:hypothetical protein